MSVVSTSEVVDDIANADSGSADSISDSESVSISDSSSDDDSLADDSSTSGGPSDGGDIAPDNSDDKNTDDKSGSGSSNDDKTAGDSQAVSSDSKEDNSSQDSSDCKLSISVDGDKKAKVGQEFELKITVKNSLNQAKNVIVKDNVLPKNFEIVSSSSSKGSYNKKLHQWELGDLKKSESVTITIKLKAKKAGSFVFEAKVLTDSNNLNKDNAVAKSSIEVSKNKTKESVKKNETKKVKNNETKKVKNNETKKVKKTKDKKKKKDKDKKDDLKDTGNPIMVLIISVCVIFGLSFLKKK